MGGLSGGQGACFFQGRAFFLFGNSPPVAAGILEGTPGAEVVDRLSGTVTEDAEPRDGKVVADGIVRI